MAVRVGVTSLFRDDRTSDEVKRHCSVLRQLDAEPVLLCPGDDPKGVFGADGPGGIVFSGGGDVSAVYYGGHEDLANDRVDQGRDEFEITLMQECLTRSMPILAVCRGMELANVVLGGTLIEDLRHHLGTSYFVAHHQLRESGIDPTAATHRVKIVDDTRLRAACGVSEMRVNSLHHQAIRRLAPGLRASAFADDGMIEAVEFESEHPFFFGVQWHPEALRNSWTEILYSQFIAACTHAPLMQGEASNE
jgi:putative glutamine amidotransferase